VPPPLPFVHAHRAMYVLSCLLHAARRRQCAMRSASDAAGVEGVGAKPSACLSAWCGAQWRVNSVL